MKKLLFCLLFVPTICLAANDDISDRPELGTAVNTDSILTVNAGNTAGDRLARILFQGTNGYVLTGNGTWFDLTSALAGKQDTLTNPLTQSDIDDTPSDGNTTQPASSNSVFDGLAGKEPVQTAASQAEAEAGTEAAIRSFSPLRTSQAIVALGANALITDTGDYFTGTTINATLQEIGEDLAGAINLTVGTTIEQTGTSPNITIEAIGVKVATNSKAADYTIGTDAASEKYGGTIYVTSAATITAPAIAAGHNFCVATIGDIAVSLDVNASDKMILDGVALADGDKATNSSKAGDTICCQYYSADGQYCWSGTVLGGHWTDGN